MIAMSHTAVNPDLLLNPYWAELTQIKTEADGTGTLWLRLKMSTCVRTIALPRSIQYALPPQLRRGCHLH